MRHLASEKHLRANPTGPVTVTSQRPVILDIEASNISQLPVVLANKKVIYVNTNTVNLEMDGVKELEKAFEKHPYLTRKEMDRLAERCSIRPEEVKVWFTVRRLRYGVSWDRGDIFWAKWDELDSNKDAVTKNGGVKDSGKSVKKSRRKKKRNNKCKKGKERVEQTATRTKTIEEEVSSNKQMKKKAVQGQTQIKETNMKTTTKRKRMVEVGKKKKQKRNENVAENAGEVEMENPGEPKKHNSMGSHGKPCTKKRNKKNKLHVPKVRPNQRNLRCSSPCTSLPSLEEYGELNITLDDESLINVIGADNGGLIDLTPLDYCPFVTCPENPPSRPPYSPKMTPQQKLFLRKIFISCQNPPKAFIKLLTTHTGLGHKLLVQWFGDTRYYIRKRKPRWMTSAQHKRALIEVGKKIQKKMTKKHKD